MGGDLIDEALRLADLGWAVFPCVPGKKEPRIKKGFLGASKRASDIRQWWKRWPDANIGVATGPASGFWVLDIDTFDDAGGDQTLLTLERENEALPEGPSQITGRGGRHRLFRWTEEFKVRNRGKFAPGLDVRGDGGYILVAPSRLDGFGPYSWITEPTGDIAEAPEWLVRRVLDHGRPKKAAPPGLTPRPVLRGAATPWGEGALQSICNEVRQCPPGAQSDTLIRRATRVGSIAAGGSIDEQYARRALVSAGMSMVNGDPGDPWTQAVIESAVDRGMRHGALDPTPPPAATQLKVVGGQEKPQPEQKPKPAPRLAVVSNDWMASHAWIYKEDGALKPASLANLKQMVEHHPDLQGMFSFDEWSAKTMILRGLPGDHREDYPRELSDHDEVATAAWLNHRGLAPQIQTVAAVIREVASRYVQNPMRDWLTGLEWDGADRAADWLTKYAGAPDTHYERTIGRKFLISAVARALTPGCKCDTMLILEGPQGLRKSTLARVLCGPQYFSDQLGDITTKESSQNIQGLWIIEVPEMDKFAKPEANAVKDFLSRTEDRYRPPYGRNVITRPRRCVFFGTINPIEGAGYIRDSTGARRFWPVKCSKIDLNAARLDRDQLWAEAVHRWRMGETWWIDEDEFDVVKEEQEDRMETDIWESKIADWLSGHYEFFTPTECLSGAVNLDVARQDQRAKNRLAAILTKLGVKATNKRHGEKRASTRGYQQTRGES